MTKRISSSERRSFLARLSAGVSAFAAVAGGGETAQGQSVASAKWQPERHEKDDWLDKASSKHKLVFDTTTSEGVGEAIAFASNFMRVNRTDYGLQNDDLAVVIVVRHRSTGFAYNDAIWAKYGVPIAEWAQFADPKTKSAPKINVYNSADYGAQLPNRGMTLDSLLKQGVQLAVCQVATRGIAGTIAASTGGNTDAIYNELVASIGSGARMVPAGIVAVNRAQERGYSFVSA
jgi:intracellular sulfur oxidation DsrE/DsrF family protein